MVKAPFMSLHKNNECCSLEGRESRALPEFWSRQPSNDANMSPQAYDFLSIVASIVYAHNPLDFFLDPRVHGANIWHKRFLIKQAELRASLETA
jgi:hypothetical protein